MNIVCIIQARMGASRFPNKVLSDLHGKPMLVRQIERIMQSKLIDTVVVATSNSITDNPIKTLCDEHYYACFRGSENNVLERYYKAAFAFEADIVVRVTGDCPLIDPEVTDKVIQYYLDNDFDYVSNTLTPTYPDGLDTQVFSFYVLAKANREATTKLEREHVIPYIKNHPDIFSTANVECEQDLSHMRWTVDYPKDLEFVRKVYKELYKKNKLFKFKDILKLLKEKPELMNINNGIERDEGYYKELRKLDRRD